MPVVVVDEQGDSTVVVYEEPQDGDEILFRTYKPFENGDIYTFFTQMPTIEEAKKEDLDRIRVVPNPYTVSSIYETSIEVKEVQFTHLPPFATIRIFNVAGELVQTIQHTNGTSIEPWNLRSYNDQDVSFGIYIYHVTALSNDADPVPTGRVQMGKMAVIR